MAYTLGTLTLPRPKKLTRVIIELAVERLIIYGKTRKKTQNRKEQFVLEYQYLTQQQYDSIMSLYYLDTPLPFTVDETNLTIAQTDVLIDIGNREYPQSGEQIRQNFQLLLTEVR